MKIIIKHKSEFLRELNFRIFEVERIFGNGKAVEVFVPELKRRVHFSFKEVLVLDTKEEFEKLIQDLDGEQYKETFSFLHNYVNENLKRDDEFFLCSAHLFAAAGRE
jgi:hypothetical protein